MTTETRNPEEGDVTISPTPDDAETVTAKERAQRAAEGYRAAEENVVRWRKERDRAIIAMHEEGHSWAEIGRTFSITPQAAMYASGLRKRTGR